MGSADRLENGWKIKKLKHAKKSIFSVGLLQNAPFRSQMFLIFFRLRRQGGIDPLTKILRTFLTIGLLEFDGAPLAVKWYFLEAVHYTDIHNAT